MAKRSRKDLLSSLLVSVRDLCEELLKKRTEKRAHRAPRKGASLRPRVRKSVRRRSVSKKRMPRSGSARVKRQAPVQERSGSAAEGRAGALPAAAQGAVKQRYLEIGEVTHFFPKIQVAAVRISRSSLAVGETLLVRTARGIVRQRVSSLQIDHRSVPRVMAQQEAGLKVNAPVAVGDRIYKPLP